MSSSASDAAQTWVQKIRPMWENLQQNLDEASEDVLESASEKAGTRRSTIIVGAGVFIVLFLFFNFGEGFIVNMIGFFYPAYASFKAIESTCKDDDRQWLTYWVVAGFGLLMETVFGFVLRMIPFYNLVKAAAVLYMQLPMFNGAKFLYENFLRALLQRHEEHIDQHLESIRSTVERALTPRGTHEMPSFERDEGEEAEDEWAASREADDAAPEEDDPVAAAAASEGGKKDQ